MTTLPLIALDLSASLDVLRALCREHPELRALGQRLGSQRVYSAEEAATIRRVWQERESRRARREAATA